MALGMLNGFASNESLLGRHRGVTSVKSGGGEVARTHLPFCRHRHLGSVVCPVSVLLFQTQLFLT